MVPNDSIQCMDQNDLIFVSNGHHFDKLQIIIVPDDRSHYCDEFRPKIVPIGQNFIRFRSVQSFIDISKVVNFNGSKIDPGSSEMNSGSSKIDSGRSKIDPRRFKKSALG